MFVAWVAPPHVHAGSRGLWWEDHRDGPPGAGPLQPDQPTRSEADNRVVGVAGQEQRGEPAQVRKVPHEDEAVRIAGQSLGPGRRVVVGSEGVALLDGDAEEAPPYLGRLPGPRPSRVEDAARSHAEPVD